MKPKLEECYFDYVSKTVLAAMLAIDCRTARLSRDELQRVINVLDSAQTLQDQIDCGAFDGFKDKGIRKPSVDNCRTCNRWADCTHPARSSFGGSVE